MIHVHESSSNHVSACLAHVVCGNNSGMDKSIEKCTKGNNIFRQVLYSLFGKF
jgi:hypothetical protein